MEKTTNKPSKKTRYTLKDGETPTQFADRVYKTEGAEHFIDSPEVKKKLEDLRGIGGISPTEFAEIAGGGDLEHDPFVLKNLGKKVPRDHVPRYESEPRNIQFNNDGRITQNRQFTAAEKKMFGSYIHESKVPKSINGAFTAAKQKGIGGVFLWPKYWQNPYQYQDYLILQDNYANTIAGRILDVIVYFSVANGIKPKLVLKNPSQYKDGNERAKKLKELHWLVEVFEGIDKAITEGNDPTPYKSFDSEQGDTYLPIYTKTSDDAGPTYDTPLQAKWSAFMTLALNFGRGAMVPNVDPDDDKVTVMVDEKEEELKNIPKIMQIIHPRDLGFNHVDPMTWRLRGIQVYNSNWILKPDQMLFMEWNPHNAVYGSMYYGYSALQSMMGSARTLRRIIEVDFPLIAKTRWSGMYWIFFKRKGEGLTTAQAEHTSILKAIKLDGINVSLEDNPTEDVNVQNIDLDPKITELIEMCKFLIQYMMSQVSMPQGLLFGEQDLNRDTLKTGIQTFTKGPIKKYRRWLLHTATQYYRRMSATVSPQSEKIKKALEEVDLIATVDEFNLESPLELAVSLAMLENVTGPWTQEAKAEHLEQEDLDQKIDPDKGPEDLPPMPGQTKMNVENEKGQKFQVDNK